MKDTPDPGQDLRHCIAARVRDLRKARGWSQAVLAERSGVSLNHVSLIEQAKRVPGIDVALRLASALGITLDALVTAQTTPEESWPAEAIGLLRSLPGGARGVVIAMLRAGVAASPSP